MYTACLYCSSSLGSNAVIEQFPVGRRLAFDGARGRLWVVCASCQRWCLAPIEERWEAIEACENAFREARVRASTPGISLVRVREGLELVRVGTPLLPEMAAWRYGREFSARRRRAMLYGAGAVGVGALGATAAVASGAGAAIIGLFALGAPVLHVTGLIGFAAYAAIDSARAISLMHDGKPVRVYRGDLRETHLTTGDTEEGWTLSLKHSFARVTLTGDEAVRTTARLLARANGSGASANAIRGATSTLASAPGAADVIRAVAGHSERLARGHRAAGREITRRLNDMTLGNDAALMSLTAHDEARNPGSLALLDAPVRLALEMALHEESERHALEVELEPLIAAWREAEEIAGIADALLVPPAVEVQLEAMRAHADRTSDAQD